ncbi:hypothetical protein [Streptomyces sp. Je 1-369]|uniref:hypothetical protein n=1 Tax=Streptomyces sp. Je 1-369 TaxID=2966192 RepID=UPI002286861A|nr:hypothetical protein [Streptomyces sp. Je 1-369]WAL97421.1 hypothetical protein NOO62_24760 [Streptomyces sp. Je 1-369]
MFGTKRELMVIALRDTDAVTDELREALATADERDRPGLERAMELVARAAAVPDAEVRGRWALRRITAAGHTGPADSVHAVRALRQAEPGLSLASAVQLSKEAAALRAT